MEPKPVLFKSADERFDMTVLLWGIEANPLTQNTARGECFLKESAGGLTSVVHAEGEIVTAHAVGEFGIESHVKRAKPFLGAAPLVRMPADDTPCEDIHYDDEKHLLSRGELERRHVGCP